MVELKNPFAQWPRKTTRIDRLALVDCVPNPFAVVVGAAAGLFHIFWAVAGPECVDSAWDRVKRGQTPTGPNVKGAKPKHRKIRGHGFATGPGIGPAPGGWGPTLIPLGNLAQRIGFGFAIADGFLNGMFYGGSLMMRYSGCPSPGSPYCQSTIDGITVWPFPAATFILGSWHVEAEEGLAGDGGGVAIPPEHLGFVTVSCNLKQKLNTIPSLPDAAFTWRIVWLPSGSPVQQNWGGLGYSATGNWLLYGQDIFPKPGDNYLAIEVTKSDGVLHLEQSHLNVYTGHIDASLDSFYCGKHPNLHT